MLFRFVGILKTNPEYTDWYSCKASHKKMFLHYSIGDVLELPKNMRFK